MSLLPSNREWQKEPATANQINFLVRAGKTRDELKGLLKGEASAMISELKKSETPREDDPATDAQLQFIKKLCSWTNEPLGKYVGSDGRISKRAASAAINELKALQDEPVKVEEGLYQVGENVYRVKKSQESGHLYAQKLVKLDEPEYVSNGVRTYKFMPEPGAMRLLRNVPQMTREQAEAFGQMSSTCVRCGIHLEETITNEDGSKRWIGPICATKMGW